jgi:hypothetical protein
LTEEGGCDIYWRNSSNGYYGGSVFVHGGDDVPAWYTTNTPTPSILTEITEDWRA